MFFILGSHPELSLAELHAVVGDKPIIAQATEWVILDEVAQTANALQARLAGVSKIGQVIGELSEWNRDEVVALLASFAMEAAGKNKISFGVSGYGISQKECFLLGKELKQQLKATGRPVRLVTSKEPQLSSVIVTENGLLSSGGEYIIFAAQGTYYITQTLTVQDYKAWSERDFGRPARDPKSGMLPPKLARMMINLSGVEPTGATLLDPFCGSGTVLAEALLMGYQQVIGTDISEKAIEDSTTNLSWLAHIAPEMQMNTKVFVQDVRQLNDMIDTPVDVIVTETFLGTPKKHELSRMEFGQEQKQLTSLYQEAFRVLARLTKAGGVMVFAAPAFFVAGSYQRLGFPQWVSTTGWQLNQSFLYHRSGQMVGREILILTKA